MCPSDIYQLPVTESGFGPGAEVFASDTQNPCSIAIRDQALAQKVRIIVNSDTLVTLREANTTWAEAGS